MFVICQGNPTTEVSESVTTCRPLINPVVDKSMENVMSCDFEKENCDPLKPDLNQVTRAKIYLSLKGKVLGKNNAASWVKKLTFVLKWLSRVGSEVGPTKGVPAPIGNRRSLSNGEHCRLGRSLENGSKEQRHSDEQNVQMSNEKSGASTFQTGQRV
ncbi:hypothetical protein TNCV_1771261 [Trichonephila clavipes]|nr:hypothetical protein TNCV_1771261 [Trichonephila clavipes]